MRVEMKRALESHKDTIAESSDAQATFLYGAAYYRNEIWKKPNKRKLPETQVLCLFKKKMYVGELYYNESTDDFYCYIKIDDDYGFAIKGVLKYAFLEDLLPNDVNVKEFLDIENEDNVPTKLEKGRYYVCIEDCEKLSIKKDDILYCDTGTGLLNEKNAIYLIESEILGCEKYFRITDIPKFEVGDTITSIDGSGVYNATIVEKGETNYYCKTSGGTATISFSKENNYELVK